MALQELEYRVVMSRGQLGLWFPKESERMPKVGTQDECTGLPLGWVLSLKPLGSQIDSCLVQSLGGMDGQVWPRSQLMRQCQMRVKLRLARMPIGQHLKVHCWVSPPQKLVKLWMIAHTGPRIRREHEKAQYELCLSECSEWFNRKQLMVDDQGNLSAPRQWNDAQKLDR